MKQIKITVIALLTLFTTAINAQESNEKTEKEKPKHEIGLDFLELIQYNKIELSYSYILNKSNSIGVTVHLFPASSVYWINKDYEEPVGIDFSYKHYFSKNYAQGFYVEGVVKYGYGFTYLHQSIQPYNVTEEYHRISLGLGIGYEYVFKNNLFIDVNARISETIFQSGGTEYLIPNGDFDFSVTLGKRF